MKRWVKILLLLLVWSSILTVAHPTTAQQRTSYVVKPGDTLFSISRRYGLDVHNLAATNNMPWNAWLYIGQQLEIPGGTTAPSPLPAPPATGNVYVVQPGDTLLGIALRHGVTVSRLATLNGLAWNSWLYVGQRLVVPAGNDTPNPTPPSTTDGTYLVQRGDTLFSIARRHGTTVTALRAANNLTSNRIYAGQRLTLPGESAPPSQPPGPTTPAPNPGTGGEKWIDINLSTQTVTAYSGQTPVFTALASTGTWRTPTVVGTYRIYAKYASTHMSGPGYNLPNVPYTMYFYRGYALHGTYWHSNFGTPMSHGCVNLATPDAEWLYNWTPLHTKVVSHY
jgi:LysM repeat protein